MSAVDEAARALLQELDGLIGESHGVCGLHLNGDPAPWGELIEGGRFERLSSMNRLRAALDEESRAQAEDDAPSYELAVSAVEELYQLGYTVRDGLLYPPDPNSLRGQGLAVAAESRRLVKTLVAQRERAAVPPTLNTAAGLVGPDLAALIDESTLAGCWADATTKDMPLRAADVAVARALLCLVTGSALLDGDKKALRDAPTLYRLVCAANNLLLGNPGLDASA